MGFTTSRKNANARAGVTNGVNVNIAATKAALGFTYRSSNSLEWQIGAAPQPSLQYHSGPLAINKRSHKPNRTPILNLLFQLSVLSLAYGSVGFLCVIVINYSLTPQPIELAAILTGGIVASTTIQVGIWSALGPGTYLQRFLVTHGIGMIALAVMGMAVFVSIESERITSPAFREDGLLVASLPMLPILSLGVQIPFLLFRGFFSWKLSHRDTPPSPSFRIDDLFVLTSVFAAAITLPSIVVQQQVPTSGRFTLAIISNVIGIAIASIFVVPAFSVFFRGKDSATGCLKGFAYILMCFVFVTCANLYFSLGQGIGDLILVSGLFFGSVSFATGLPWILARNLGFELISNRRPPTRQRNSKHSTPEKNDTHPLDD